MAEYANDMDKECVVLCDAINRIPGLRTIESCCGHGHHNFTVYFKVTTLEHLPILLYYISACHVGFTWDCRVYTDCGMNPVYFMIESRSFGENAYNESSVIAQKINKYMTQYPGGLNKKRDE